MCFWQSIVELHIGRKLSYHDGIDIGILAALGTWRYSKGIYQINEDVLNALWETPLSGDLPVDVMTRLPEWCVYVATPGRPIPGKSDRLHGVFLQMAWDVQRLELEFRATSVMDCALCLPIPVRLGLGGTLTDAIERSFRYADDYAEKLGNTTLSFFDNQEKAYLSQEVLHYINLALYLCSDEPEYDGHAPCQSYPSPVRTKKGMRMFPADRTRLWSLGAETGAKIRKYQDTPLEDPTGRTVRPHLRRSHWHGYWHGPQRTHYKYNWLSPIFVGEK